MKIKSMFAALIALVVFVCCGCDSEPKPSDKAISIAKQAVSVADRYLDGGLSQGEAKDLIDDLYDDMAYVDDLADDDPHKNQDLYVSIDVLSLSTRILLDENDSKSFDGIVKARNDLAEYTNISAR